MTGSWPLADTVLANVAEKSSNPGYVNIRCGFVPVSVANADIGAYDRGVPGAKTPVTNADGFTTVIGAEAAGGGSEF